jgi:uncharacterized protein YbaP (TraB family)
MKKLVFCLIALFPSLIFAQSSKKYPALLWKISGNGLKKPSYLYGTMHVSNRVAYYLSEQFFEALKSVDVVGLETNPGEWLENMEKTGELVQMNQFSGVDYSRDFYRSAFSVSFPDKKLLQGVLSYDPDIIDGLLYRQNRSRENFEENTYIDLFIFQSASKLNKRVISLENFAQSQIQARLSALPDEEEESDGSRYKDYYSAVQKIEDAYRDGNLDMLDSLSKLAGSKNSQRYLIDNRNVFFVNTIDSVLKTHSLFSGVGAAHLPGDNGVIELLRKKGYEVEAVAPKVTKKSNATREELDLLVKPVVFKKQYINDSLFSYNLPGRFSQIANLDNLKYYIYADMVNGSFYTVVRLKYLGPLSGTSPQQIMQRVDSLLFEHIPGKILSKKEIVSNTGLKGLEVINVTRRGDEQRYQIFFTDLEMILFKLGGKRQYASSSDSKQFFNSIQFAPRSEGFLAFAPPTKGFEVRLPANYAYTRNDAALQVSLVEDLFGYSKSGNQFMGVKHAVYNDFNYLEVDTFELSQFSKNILVNYNYKESPVYENGVEQGFPCARFTARNKQGSRFYGKLYIKGTHYYLLYFISEKESSFDNEFFRSFRLTDFEYTNPIKVITDPDFYFKAKDELTDNALSRFNEAYSKAYEAVKPKKDTIRRDYEYRSDNKFYYSPSSHECVNISYEKYNDYDYMSVKDLEEKMIKNIKKFQGLYPSNIKSNRTNGLFTFTSTLRDTATSRVIDLRVFVKNGIRYEISAPYDTVIGLKGWTREFIESFQPKDTVIGKDIFENKFPRLLADLLSKDTTLRKAADNSVQTAISMQKAYTADFIDFISDKKLEQVNSDSRAQLFVNGGTLESDKIVEPYKKLYRQYTDSFYLQLCLLKGLAYRKSAASFGAFYNLVMEETPLVGSESTVTDVFSVLHDSLELCKAFFPGMLTLTKYDEYRPAVYTLMASLVNKKIISPPAYALKKDDILADANLALKRFNPQSIKPLNAEGEYASLDYLDKSVKEQAETIQANTEGFTSNRLYKGTAYLRNQDSHNRPALVNYAYILAPFYKTDEKTRQFFAKLSKIRAQAVIMPVAINLMKYNVVINDTLAGFYAKNKITRAYFYSELDKEKLTDKFDKHYLDEKSLVESVLSNQKQLTWYYSYEKDKNKKDSLILLKIMPARNRYQQGNLYVYKSSRARNDEEQWSVAFVNHSKEPVSTAIEVVSAGFAIDKAKTEQENLNELLDYFYRSYRKRAASDAGPEY